MKLAPLQLESYFVTEVNCRANLDFDPKKPTTFHQDDLAIAADAQPLPDQPQRWQITLNLKLQPKASSNSPYNFSLVVLGIVWAAPDLPRERLELIVRTNGPSMLYGAAREMARDITARGPFPPLTLPSVSFIPDAPVPPAPTAPEPGEKPQPAAEASAPSNQEHSGT
jgi:preprotein translocase subunit SecB